MSQSKLRKYQQIIDMHIQYPRRQIKTVARMVGCSKVHVRNVLKAWESDEYIFQVDATGKIIPDTIKKQDQVYATLNPYAGAGDLETETLSFQDELEADIQDVQDEIHFQWYAAGILTGIVGTLAVMFFADKLI